MSRINRYGCLSNLLRLLISLLFGIITAIIVLEFGVRALKLAPPGEPVGVFWQVPHPDYGWYHTPGAAGPSYSPFNEYNVWVTINSQGLRDIEREYTKPAGTFRILLLGDSFIEGMRTELDQTAGKVLEARLNAAADGKRYEVINAGVGAWGTDQQLLWLEKEGIKYEPDLVLLAFFVANDFMNNSEYLEVRNQGGAIYKPFFALQGDALALKYHPFDPSAVPQPPAPDQPVFAPEATPPLASWRPWLHDHAALYRYLAPLLPEVTPALAGQLARLGLLDESASKAAAIARDFIPPAYGVYAAERDPAWDASVTLTAALIERMAKTARDVGAQFATVILPSQEQVYPDVWQRILQRYPAMQDGDWRLTRPNEDLAGVLTAAGLPYFDLLPAFQAAATGPLLYLPRDKHWTVAGERLAGELMAEWVQQFLSAATAVPALAADGH